jgi:hypothetical protein
MKRTFGSSGMLLLFNRSILCVLINWSIGEVWKGWRCSLFICQCGAFLAFDQPTTCHNDHKVLSAYFHGYTSLKNNNPSNYIKCFLSQKKASPKHEPWVRSFRRFEGLPRGENDVTGFKREDGKALRFSSCDYSFMKEKWLRGIEGIFWQSLSWKY